MMVVLICPEFSSGLPPASHCWELPDAGWVKEFVSAVQVLVSKWAQSVGFGCLSYSRSFSHISSQREKSQCLGVVRGVIIVLPYVQTGCHSVCHCLPCKDHCLPRLGELGKVLCLWTLLLN